MLLIRLQIENEIRYDFKPLNTHQALLSASTVLLLVQTIFVKNGIRHV